jgi:alkanesulfonate monooxygenase SsuD/methylene tetrahydromethanopterin reductase-like flavin-dependent oxidoreductase (luciferase family)
MPLHARRGDPGGPDAPLVEPISALSFVAGLTSKIKLGTGIMILPQRHPLYVAKEVATLDLISGGRAILGIGSGWCAEEFAAPSRPGEFHPEHRVAGGSHPPPAPTERSVRMSG